MDAECTTFILQLADTKAIIALTRKAEEGDEIWS